MNGMTYKILIGVDLRLEIAILVVTIIESRSEIDRQMSAHIRNFSWNRVKLSTLTYDELDQLRKKVEEEHACNNGIFLYDKSGLKKLDALSWAVYHKMKAEKKAKQG